MKYNIELRLPEGSRSDLEIYLFRHMIEKARKDPEYPKANPWGEFNVLQGKVLYGIQWTYVGLEMQYDEDENELGLAFEDGEPDFEVSCSWREVENYEDKNPL